jgi:hypothetical protein
MSGNWGTYEGQNGLAVNAAVRLASSVQLNGGIAWGLNENLAGGRVGVRVALAALSVCLCMHARSFGFVHARAATSLCLYLRTRCQQCRRHRDCD